MGYSDAIGGVADSQKVDNIDRGTVSTDCRHKLLISGYTFSIFDHIGHAILQQTVTEVQYFLMKLLHIKLTAAQSTQHQPTPFNVNQYILLTLWSSYGIHKTKMYKN